MNDALKKIKCLLKKFNNTFEISAIIQDDTVNGLKIDGLKSDGTEFIAELFEIFNTIVTGVSDDHEVIYNEEKGLVIAKKIVLVDYQILEDESEDEE
ncbi:MAG: hypothetical protein ACOCP8_03695 [archaeon]